MSTPTASETGERSSNSERSSNTFFGDVWVNFVRWNIKAVRNRFVLFGSLVQPIIFLVLFTQVFGHAVGGNLPPGVPNYTTYLLPAIVIQVSLVTGATSGIGLVNDIENGMF